MKNLVEIKNGQAITSSRRVAQDFGKRHDNIIRDIEGLLNFEETPKSLFYKSSYVHEQNNQEYPEYLMNRDGFVLLVMGFSGVDALRVKLKYINAFNMMEKRLQTQVPTLTPSTRPRYRARMINTAVKDVDATVKTLQKMFGVREGIAQATAIEMVEDTYGIDMTPIRKLIPAATHETGYLNPTMIGERLGGMKAKEVNLRLEALGLQWRAVTDKGDKKWRLTKAGKEYGEELPYKRNGHSDYRIGWNEKVLKLLGKEVA